MFADDAFENFCILDTGLNFPPIPYHFYVAENCVGLAHIIACNGLVIEEVLANRIQFSSDRRSFKPRIEDNTNQNPVVIGITESLTFRFFELIKVLANFISGEFVRTNPDERGFDFIEDGFVIFYV